MNELVQLVQQKTGISQEMAQQIVQLVVGHIKGKLPASMASGLDGLLGEGGGGATGDAGSLVDKAKGMFGSKDA